MVYATQQSILDRVGEDVLFSIADRDGDGVLDVTAIEAALAASSAVMDGYIGMREALPMPVAPKWAEDCCVDMAVKRLALAAGRLTDEMTEREKEAVKRLEKFAAGTFGPGLARADEPVATDGGEVKGTEILVQAGKRNFGRCKTRGL